jgi:TonB family protein
VITHGAILCQNPNFNLFPLYKNKQKVKINYVRIAPEKKTSLKIQPLPRGELSAKLLPKISTDKKPPPPFIDKDYVFKANKIISTQTTAFVKPVVAKPDIISVKKKISLPPLDMDKINNASYISYYQIVREKIRRAAYQNYTRTETGEVYLSFIISTEGYLREVRLVEEKSSFSPYLREIALRSIKEASPFPDFPKELDYPQLTFNVVISFEIE